MGDCDLNKLVSDLIVNETTRTLATKKQQPTTIKYAIIMDVKTWIG